MRNKKNSLLRKYQNGTQDPNLVTWDWSGSQSSIPGNQNFSNASDAPQKGGSFNSQSALSGQNIAGYATAAINLGAGIANAVAANKSAKAQLSAGKRNKALFDIESAKNRSAMVQKRYANANLYGNYPTMQYGGMYGSETYRNPYANTFTADQLNTEEYMVDQQTGEDIAESVSDTVLYNMPGFGQIMQVADQASGMIRNIHGERKAVVEDGSYRDVYGLEGDTPGEAQARGVISSMVKPAHEHGMESFARAAEADSSMDKFKYSMEGIGDMLGFTTIPKMIKSGMDSKANQEKMLRDQRQNALRTNVGGTSGLSGQTVQRGNYLDSPYAMEMGGYLDKYRGGGLYANIHAKRARIKAGSGETMRSQGDKGAPTAANFERAAKTAKKQMGGSVPEYGASGMVEYGKGGIYIDPAKRGTFKAQASKMDMGVQEAASKILSAPEGEYSPEMRKKANFARNFAKETGGYLKQYMNGGMRPYQMGGEVNVIYGDQPGPKNAEVENNETIAHSDGSVTLVKGKPHEKGGVKLKLKEGGPAEGGDYVFSDHLKTQDPETGEVMSMAELHLKYKEDPRMMRWVMQTQEQLAGRENSNQDQMALEQIPSAKTGGMLKKYQTGTNSRTLPDGTEMPILSDSEYDRIMKEKQMKDLEALRNSDEYNEGMANLSRAPGSAANVATGAYGKLPSKEEVEREKAMKRAADVQYYKEQGLNAEGQPYSEADLKSANVGEVGSGNLLSKTGTQVYGKRSAGDKAMELLPYGAAGLGAIAQLAATLGAKNPYKGLKTPKASLVPTPEKQFFERTDSRTQEAANQRGAALSKQLLQQAGFGPGETAALQKVELDRAAADAQATQQAREFNIQQDRAEKQLNTELKLRADIANQAALNERSMQEYQRQLSERGFETERAMSVGDVVSGTMKDVASYGSDANFARAIYGDSGIGQRAWNYDPVQARAEIMAENPQKDGESASEYQSRISKLERENAKKYNDEYMKTVASRRRRYTQMRSEDGEQG